MLRRYKFGLLTAAVLATPFVHAYEAGSVLVRAGVVNVNPDSGSSDDLRLNGDPQPGLKVSVDDNYQFGVTATYMMSNQFGVNVVAATPFKHDIEGAGTLSGAGKLAETKHLPPTLTLVYYPQDSANALQPYLGLGVNYTLFFEEKTTNTLTEFLQGIDPGINSTTIDLSNSFGFAVQAGADYRLTDRIALNAGVWWADIATTATIKALDADKNRLHTAKVDVDIDPMVYMLGISYKF